jgi:magnesium transporter
MLINCVAYENGSRLADLSVEEISDYLAKPNCFVWVALRDATAQELDQMLAICTACVGLYVHFRRVGWL